MKRMINALAAVWIFNMFLWFMLMTNPGIYAALRAGGVEWFTCMDWDANGHPFASDQCTDAPPVYEPGQ